MTPASMTPIDCAVIGTGMKPSMIGGSSPSATMMAAKRAERTRSRVLMALGLSGNWIAVVPADAARVNGGGDLVGGLQRLDDQRHDRRGGPELQAARPVRLGKVLVARHHFRQDRKSTRLNSSH